MLKHKPVGWNNSNFENCLTFAERTFALDMVPKHGIVAEVGVAYGDFSETIIQKLEPAAFYAIDTFDMSAGHELQSNRLAESKLTHLEYYYQKFDALIENGVVHLKKGLSWDMLSEFSDNFFDFVYLDAAHDYDSVRNDVMVLLNKIKNGGYIQFNDFTFYNTHSLIEYGVVQVVSEFLKNNKHQARAFCLQYNGFYDILIQINK
jgi:hypothetical protein